MKKIIILISILFLLVSCDEINKLINPSSDEYIVDKTIYTSTNEQIVESGNDFKIIFPGQSLAGNLELKIKKESSFPAFNVSNTKLGSNIYRIKFKGNTSFLTPVKISINYDKSQIPSGKTASESVKGYIYSNSNWKLSNFVLDEINSKIIISISNLTNPKTLKDSPQLLDNEGEMIIADGYSNTDSGNQDNLLAKTKIFYVNFSSSTYTNGRTILYNLFSRIYNTTDTIKLSFSGNSFSANYDSAPGVDPANVKPGDTFEFKYKKLSLNGSIENNNYKKMSSFILSESRNYYASGYGWDDEQSSLSLNNFDLTFESQKKDTLIYEIKDASKSSSVSSFSWFFNDLWESKQYSQGKADLKTIKLVFINK